MASTLTSIMSKTRAFDPNEAGLGHAGSALGLDSAIDSKETLDELRQSVEAKSAKALARARWKKLRNVIHGLEFPKIHVNEDKLASLRLNAQKVKADSTHAVEVSREWLLQLQDFWEQSSGAKQRMLAGRGPKKVVAVDSQSTSHRIRVALNSTPSIFEPGSNFVVGWALVQAVLLLYITIVVPFTAVYLSDLDCFPEWSTCIDLIIDTYFLADILVNAASPFKTQTGKMERHLITCAKRYMRQQLLPDAILSIPVAWLQVGLSGQIFCDPYAVTDDNDSSVDATSLSLVRLPRLLRILRLLRIMKVLKLFDLKIFDVVKHTDPNVIALGKIMCFVIVFCHFLACIWWLVKRDDPNIEKWYGELKAPYPNTPVMEQYISSLYFIITTLTTVGYGDIHGTNDNERVFLVCVMFGGTLIFATIISSASQIVANLGASSNRLNAQLKNVFNFCKKWNVPSRQSNRVIDYCDAVATVEDQNLAWDNVFMDLPHSIQCQISLSIVKNFFPDNPMLSTASTKFLCAFFSVVKQCAFLPAQVLFDEGSISDPCIYFIKSGCVRLFVVGDIGDTDVGRPSTIHIIKDFNPGEIVGLVSTVLWQPSLGTAVSVGQTHCFVLPQSQLLALFRKFPDFEADILDFAMSQLISHTEALKDVKNIAREKGSEGSVPKMNMMRRVSMNIQSVAAFNRSTSKVAPAPAPQPEPPLVPPLDSDSKALQMLSQAENSAKENKLKQHCTQLARLLSEAKFEEMLLVVEGVNGKDRLQLIQSGTFGQVQHAVLVMKQLVLLHGVPSDVKVSSVFNEDSDREPLNHEGITARRSFWKSKPDSPTFPVTPGTPHVSSGAQAIQNFTNMSDIIPKFGLVT